MGGKEGELKDTVCLCECMYVSIFNPMLYFFFPRALSHPRLSSQSALIRGEGGRERERKHPDAMSIAFGGTIMITSSALKRIHLPRYLIYFI